MTWHTNEKYHVFWYQYFKMIVVTSFQVHNYALFVTLTLQITKSNLELQKIERELRDELASMYFY